MRHKYAHIKNLDELRNEIEMSRIRKQVLIEEINSNLHDARVNFSFASSLVSGIGSMFSMGPKNAESQGVDKLESILKIATKIGGIVALIRTFKRSK